MTHDLSLEDKQKQHSVIDTVGVPMSNFSSK